VCKFFGSQGSKKVMTTDISFYIFSDSREKKVRGWRIQKTLNMLFDMNDTKMGIIVNMHFWGLCVHIGPDIKTNVKDPFSLNRHCFIFKHVFMIFSCHILNSLNVEEFYLFSSLPKISLWKRSKSITDQYGMLSETELPTSLMSAF
jgi:hypothetical protein